jgi:uncharacterized membrane protein YeaQ/YmgE (transglycosylase-associated protein family)
MRSAILALVLGVSGFLIGSNVYKTLGSHELGWILALLAAILGAVVGGAVDVVQAVRAVREGRSGS